MRRLLLAAALAAGLSAWSTASAAPTPPHRFVTHCNFYPTYQRAQIDPIVAHGQAQSAHSHDFYGDQQIGPDTVAATVLPPSPPRPAGLLDPGYAPVPSSCGAPGTLQDYGDWPGYWFPTALVNGTVTPAYNRTGDAAPYSTETNTWSSPRGSHVLTPPFGMTYVAGSSDATTPSAESSHVAWSCGGLAVTWRRPHDCTGRGVVTAIAHFPRCWNGLHGWGQNGWDGTSPPNYDGAAGIDPSDFAYGSPCPHGYKAIAQLTTREHFTTPSGGPLIDPVQHGRIILSFASGGWYSYHADFLNLWNIGLKTLVDECLNRSPAAATCSDPLR